MGMVEAKAYGLPIVCYELANVDMVREPKGMRVVRQKDCAEAAKQVVALLEDDALRTELGRESRESAEEISSFDLETHWQHILDLATIVCKLCLFNSRNLLYLIFRYLRNILSSLSLIGE